MQTFSYNCEKIDKSIRGLFPFFILYVVFSQKHFSFLKIYAIVIAYKSFARLLPQDGSAFSF